MCSNLKGDDCPRDHAQLLCCLQCSTVDASNSLDFPPYDIHNGGGHLSLPLSFRTLAMSAQQTGNVSIYNTHNLYGLMEQIATNKALVEIREKRPFVLSRSSFLSTGVHAAKWQGDNAATWEDLKSSIVSLLDFSIFGVPMMGADICKCVARKRVTRVIFELCVLSQVALWMIRMRSSVRGGLRCVNKTEGLMAMTISVYIWLY